MKILLAVHGYPPELVGGTEYCVQQTAHGLARAGHDVVVAAGSIRWEEGFGIRRSTDRDPATGSVIRVAKIQRDDLYFDHWQKLRCERVSRAFRELVASERPDVLHVHHWIRLTDDLVRVAAEEGVPAVVTLHDFWTSCLVTHRLRPSSLAVCDVPLASDPCLGCAASAPPRTPWRSAAEQAAALAQRRDALALELRLARAVLCLSHSQRATLGRFLPGGVDQLQLLAPGRDVAATPAPRLALPRELGRLVLGCWGSLSPLKGQDVILAAADLLRRRAVPVEVHLAGTDSDPAFVRRLRAEAPAGSVFFHGPYPDGELPRHPVTRVHAMVSGTRARETWGLVLDEAVALRLPMVLPRSGSYEERFGDGRGALFYEARSATQLADALERLWTEPALLARLRTELPDVSTAVPPRAAHVAALEALYRDAARAGAPRPPARTADGDGIAAWDDALRQFSASELGLSEP